MKGLVHSGLSHVGAELALFAVVSEPGVPVAALEPPFSSQSDIFFQRTRWEATNPAEVGNVAHAWCLALMVGLSTGVFSSACLPLCGNDLSMWSEVEPL